MEHLERKKSPHFQGGFAPFVVPAAEIKAEMEVRRQACEVREVG